MLYYKKKIMKPCRNLKMQTLHYVQVKKFSMNQPTNQS